MEEPIKYLTKQELERLDPDGNSASIEKMLESIDNLFTYHPYDDVQLSQSQGVRATLREAYSRIIQNVRPGPTRTRALNALLDCRMLANAAITFPGQ